ncbi:MAG: hypothetical protein KatS3mg017_0159 [Fimbriimonadales bacterium]|nr:MAG: hypothetical protein KatS3mg017_0159 [Fimbriimonadales bacterium]
MRYAQNSSVMEDTTKYKSLKASLCGRWVLSAVLLLLLSGLWGQSPTGGVSPSDEPSVRVYEVRVECTINFEYLEPSSDLKETGLRMACVFQFDTPISWAEALSLVSTWFESLWLDLKDSEAGAMSCGSVWDDWYVSDWARGSWRPPGVELYEAIGRYPEWRFIYTADL